MNSNEMRGMAAEARSMGKDASAANWDRWADEADRAEREAAMPKSRAGIRRQNAERQMRRMMARSDMECRIDNG